MLFGLTNDSGNVIAAHVQQRMRRGEISPLEFDDGQLSLRRCFRLLERVDSAYSALILQLADEDFRDALCVWYLVLAGLRLVLRKPSSANDAQPQQPRHSGENMEAAMRALAAALEGGHNNNNNNAQEFEQYLLATMATTAAHSDPRDIALVEEFSSVVEAFQTCLADEHRDELLRLLQRDDRSTSAAGGGSGLFSPPERDAHAEMERARCDKVDDDVFCAQIFLEGALRLFVKGGLVEYPTVATTVAQGVFCSAVHDKAANATTHRCAAHMASFLHAASQTRVPLSGVPSSAVAAIPPSFPEENASTSARTLHPHALLHQQVADALHRHFNGAVLTLVSVRDASSGVATLLGVPLLMATSRMHTVLDATAEAANESSSTGIPHTDPAVVATTALQRCDCSPVSAVELLEETIRTLAESAAHCRVCGSRPASTENATTSASSSSSAATTCVASTAAASATTHLHRHLSLLASPSFPDEEDVIDKVVVSQILNRIRRELVSGLSAAERGAVVTSEVLEKHFLEHSRNSGGAVANKLDETTFATEDDVAEARLLLKSVLAHVRFERFAATGFTVLDALRFDGDGIPLLSPETIASLNRLSELFVVSRGQVSEVIEADPILSSDPQAVDEALEAVFPRDARVVPGSLLQEIVAKVQEPVHKVRFSKPFVHDVVHSMRALATSLPYVALIVVVLVMVFQLDLWGRFASYLNASTPFEYWSNYCEAGGVVNGSCVFHKRNIEEAVSMEETLRFVQYEVVMDLWKYAAAVNESTSAASVLFEGSWLVGALLLRISPPVGTPSTPSAPLHACNELNLSVPFYHPAMGAYFDCSFYKAKVIPFSLTKEEALYQSHHFDVEVPAYVDASLLVQYAMYAPSTGAVTWVTISLGLPKLGGVVTETRVFVLDREVSAVIRVAFWISLVAWAVDLLSLFILWREHIGFGVAVSNFLFRSALLALISVSYYFLVTSEVDNGGVSSLLAVDYVIPGLDHSVTRFVAAVEYFALWVLFLILLMMQLIAYLDGFKIVVNLVAKVVPDVVGLLFVFGFLYVMFVMVAVILFGQTSVSYSNFFNANAQLLPYFLLKFDLTTLEENYPESGFAFYFVFRVFIFYLVLNFFVVTTIAPIRSVWLEGDLPLAVNNVVQDLHASSGPSWWGLLWAHLERYVIMTVDLAVGFVPVTLPYWMHCHRCIDRLYDPSASTLDFLRACQFLLTLRRKTHSAARYDSERALMLPGLKLAGYEASYHVCRLVLQSETENRWIRDARTMRLLATFDEFTTKTERELHPPKDEKEVVLPPPNRLQRTAATDEAASPAARHPAPSSSLPEANQTLPQSEQPRHRDEQRRARRRARLARQHPHFAVDGTTAPSSSPPPPLMGEGSLIESASTTFDSPSVIDAVKSQEANFHFTRHLVNHICDHRFFSDAFYVAFSFVNRGAMVALYLAMLIVVNTTHRSMPYFSLNAHSGIRDLYLKQSCSDANCSEGYTRHWTYQDNRRLDHLRDFVHRRLHLSLFRDDSPDATHHVPDLSDEHRAVTWDNYIVLSGPLYVRQIRARDAPCVVPPLAADELGSAEALDRQTLIASQECGDRNSFSVADMAVPTDTQLDPSAYLYQNSCPEFTKRTIYGIRYIAAPCVGYTAVVQNASQLLYAIDNFIDHQTRFVGITFHLRNTRSEQQGAGVVLLEYGLYAELSEGGSAGQFLTRTTPITDPELDQINTAGIVIMTIDGVFGMLEIVIPVLHCVNHRRCVTLAQLPTVSYRVLFYVAYLVFWLLDLGSLDQTWPRLAAAVVMIVWLTLQVLFDVVLPVGQIFFRRVAIVNFFIRLTIMKVTLLLPIFAIVLAAFSLSGYVMWSSEIKAFSTVHRSFYTTSQGLLGDLEFDDLFEANPTFALLFTVLFLVVIIFVLLNLLLAIIAGCADETREDSQIMEPIEAVARTMRRHVFFGPLIGVVMNFFVRDGSNHGDVEGRAQSPPGAAPGTTSTTTKRLSSVLPPMIGQTSVAKVRKALRASKGDAGDELRIQRSLGNPFIAHLENGTCESAEMRGDVGNEHDGFGADAGIEPRVAGHGPAAAPEAVAALLRTNESHVANAERAITTTTTAAGQSLKHRIARWFLSFIEPPETTKAAALYALEEHRLPTPHECLLARLGPALLSEVTHVLKLREMPESLQCSIVAHVLSFHQQFEVLHPGLYAQDSFREEDVQLQVLGAFHLAKAFAKFSQSTPLSPPEVGGLPADSVARPDAPSPSDNPGGTAAQAVSKLNPAMALVTSRHDTSHSSLASFDQERQSPRRILVQERLAPSSSRHARPPANSTVTSWAGGSAPFGGDAAVDGAGSTTSSDALKRIRRKGKGRLELFDEAASVDFASISRSLATSYVQDPATMVLMRSMSLRDRPVGGNTTYTAQTADPLAQPVSMRRVPSNAVSSTKEREDADDTMQVHELL